MPNANCESCMMPFSQDPGKRENEKYCSYCFNHGKLCYEGNDVKAFKKGSYDAMVRKGMNPLKAWLFTSMIGFAPRWRKK